jgi:hypothetical protein
MKAVLIRVIIEKSNLFFGQEKESEMDQFFWTIFFCKLFTYYGTEGVKKRLTFNFMEKIYM